MILIANDFYVHFIDVGMEDAIDEANARAFVWVLFRQLYVNLPQPALEGS